MLKDDCFWWEYYYVETEALENEDFDRGETLCVCDWYDIMWKWRLFSWLVSLRMVWKSVWNEFS